MDSAKFQRHRKTFGIIYIFFNFPRRYYLSSPCYARNFDTIFRRQAKNNCVDGFCKIPETLDNVWYFSKSEALGEFFFFRGTCPGGWSGDLVFFFLRVVGGHPGLGISFGPEHFARCGGPRTWVILSPSRGMRMGSSSLRRQFCWRRWAWEGEGRIEAT